MTLWNICKATALAALFAVTAAPAFAQSLTTQFAHDNASAGNTFDLTPTTSLLVSGFDVNVGRFGTTSGRGGGAGETVRIAIYWRPGTSDGFESNSAGWTLLGRADVISQGTDNPTHVPVGGLFLSAGQTYGIYVDLEQSGGTNYLLYTNGGPSDYSNADLTLRTYYGKGPGAFTGPYAYREWNGTVYYRPYTFTTCRAEGFTGTKLTLCQQICEVPQSPLRLSALIKLYVAAYREDPPCARVVGR